MDSRIYESMTGVQNSKCVDSCVKIQGTVHIPPDCKVKIPAH